MNNKNFKAFIFVLLRFLLPGLIICGLLMWIFWVAAVSFKSSNTALTVFCIFSNVAVLIIIAFLSILTSSSAMMSFFASETKVEYYLKCHENGDLTFEKKNSGYGIIFYVLLGVLFALLSIPLTIIGMIRLACSSKYRDYCAELYDELFKNEKPSKIVISIISVCLVFFMVMTICTAVVQNRKSIDIFEEFRTETKYDKKIPTFELIDINVKNGGVYINGYRVELKVKVMLEGNDIVTGIDSTFNLNYENKNLLNARVTFDIIDIGETFHTIVIDCENTDNIRQLQSLQANQIEMNVKLKYVRYINDIKQFE